MPERFKSYLNKKNLTSLAVIAGICLFYVILEGIGITCPILFFTGVSCAGCGMSRAWRSLLSGNIALAFSYHPLFWLPPVILLGWLFRKRLPQKVMRALFWVCCGLFLIVYAVRMVDPEDTIVVFQPREGILAKAVFFLSEFLDRQF